jgi:MoaA/NifB/PqqE/SkfB family radical SAM enzyme
MKIPHDKFCVLPWVSLETSPIGTVRPCCLADHEVTDDQGIKITLGETSFTDIREGNYMRGLRQQFLQAQQPETCRRCWAEEGSGRTSKRMHTLDRLKHMINDETWTEDAKPLMFLDLKLGNICNLKCRICGSWSSSTFAAEEIRYQTDKKNNFHYVMMKLGQWPREEKRFWADLEKNMDQLQYLEFTGGEPFMIQEHFELLEKLVNRRRADKIEIHYNTNGTHYPVEAEKIWKNFKHVEIAFSIDDTGARFEYQRTGASWEEVQHNLEKFVEMRERNSNISLQMCCTVNVYNICHLADISRWIDTQNFDYVYWNILHDPYYLSIANLSSEIKKSVTDYINTANAPNKWSLEFKKILDFMNNGSESDGEELLLNIKKLDQRRSVSLATVDPILAEILGYQ